QQREAGTSLLIVDADVALVIQRHESLSLHSVVFRVRSHIAQTREPLELSSRHGCAAPLPRDGVGGGRPAERAPVPRVCDGGGGTAERAPFLCGDSCTRLGAAGQGWHQPDDLSENRMQAIVSLAPPGC